MGGFRSDMTGTKALFLEEYCRRREIPYVRFDYFGHGASSGDFALGTIAFCFGYAVFFANVLLMPLWMQTQLGYTATWAGLVAAPSGVPTAGMPSTSPKRISHVVEALSPILCSRLVAKTPLRSPSSPVARSTWYFGTMNSDSPLVPAAAP